MMRWTFLGFLGLCASMYSDSSECSCGTIRDDVFYAKAVRLLYEGVMSSPFYFLDEGACFPKSALYLYPSFDAMYDELCYDTQGRINWYEAGATVFLDKHFMEVTNEQEREKFAFNSACKTPLLSNDKLAVPAQFVRTLESSVSKGNITDYEITQKQVFKFKKNYGVIAQAFRILKKDIVFHYEENDQFLDARIQDIANHVDVCCEGVGGFLYVSVPKILREYKKDGLLSYCRELECVEKNESEALLACKVSLDWCIAHHRNPVAHVNRGLFYYLEGNAVEALDQLQIAVSQGEHDAFKQLEDEALLVKGQAELEAGLYAEAVLSLSALVERSPKNKEVYFERANAYFELGDFDLSLNDYLTSEIKPYSVSSINMTAFSLGLTQGILQGGMQSGVEFIPSLLSSMQGIGHGLWAFAQDPVQVSIEFVQASQACIDFIRVHTSQEALEHLVPELKELIEKWDELEDVKRGNSIGSVIGKYGVDIFLGGTLVKGVQAVRALKQANNILTFEAMAASEKNASLIKLEAARRAQARTETLQHANLKVQWDKQGKHLEGHRNFISLRDPSILVHSEPQKLVNDFAGKGMKCAGAQPGTAGYVEIVDFKEFVGYAVDPATGKKTATTWGKIHYARDGVHIVPTKSRS